MIKSDQQFVVTKTKLKELESRLDRLKRKYHDLGDYDFYSEATRDTIALMKFEIREYQLVKTGAIDKILRVWAKRGAVVPTRKLDLTLGEFIAMLRLARGLTQEQLASRLGMEQANVSRFEQRGYTGFTVETLSRILSALGVRLAIQPLEHGPKAASPAETRAA